MAKKSSDRVERERVRAYRARTQLHERQVNRRKRDNRIAAVAGIAAFALAVGLQVAVVGTGASSQSSPAATPTASPAGANQGPVPPATLAENRDWSGELVMNGVPVGFTLNGALAPQAVSSEISLIQSGFYSTANSCHRLTNSIVQCGDPNGDGSGGPGYSYGPIENAAPGDRYPAGTIAMARRGNDGFSQGSQFFIVLNEVVLPSDAAGGYSVIGSVTSGLPELQAMLSSIGVAGGAQDGPPAAPVVINSISIQ